MPSKSTLYLFIHNGEMNNEDVSLVDVCVKVNAYLPETLEQAKQLVREALIKSWSENGKKTLSDDDVEGLNQMMEDTVGVYRVDERTATDIEALDDIPSNLECEQNAIQGAKKRLAHINRMFCWGDTMKR